MHIKNLIPAVYWRFQLGVGTLSGTRPIGENISIALIDGFEHALDGVFRPMHSVVLLVSERIGGTIGPCNNDSSQPMKLKTLEQRLVGSFGLLQSCSAWFASVWGLVRYAVIH
jgi:hypothetical protein